MATDVHAAPAAFGDLSPYTLVIVAMDDGPRLTAQLVDHEPEEAAIGRRVRLEFRRMTADGDTGLIHYGYKCVPA